MTGRPSTSSSQSGLSSITSWWVGEAGHMLLGVLDINGALVSLTSLPSLWLRLHDEQTIRPVVVPVSIHGDTISRDEFVCGLWILTNFANKSRVFVHTSQRCKSTKGKCSRFLLPIHCCNDSIIVGYQGISGTIYRGIRGRIAGYLICGTSF